MNSFFFFWVQSLYCSFNKLDSFWGRLTISGNNWNNGIFNSLFIGYAEFKYGMPAIYSKIPWNLLYIPNVATGIPCFSNQFILLKFYNAF